MKFTNGFWVVKPEYRAEYARDCYSCDFSPDTLTAYMPYTRVAGRGDTLNVGMMTVALSSPMEDVLRVRLTAHRGACLGQPYFPLLEGGPCGQVSQEDGAYRISSGRLSAQVHTGSPCLSFCADGQQLTRTREKTTAMMTHQDGSRYLVTGLELDVGELVYGLGERFTPYVKNGQTVDTWNEDGGTASEISYKSIPFYMTNRGYGVLVNHPGKVSFEVGSEKVETVQFSVQDEELEYLLIYGPTPKEILTRYTALTGRAPVLPKWTFGLWLTTSFTTNYDEKTVMSFIDGMAQRSIPLHVFHFDCFWMKGFEWCNFAWDKEQFPDPAGMLQRIHAKGLKVCVWINPYIAQKSPLFDEGMRLGYLLRREDGKVWQWDMWQAGMALVDFTNKDAWKWYQEKLKGLLDMGVDCFKTDFGERIPTDMRWSDGSDPQKMHNYYTYLYNRCVFELLKQEKDEAVLFARSATVGCQQFPVHWGGDSTSQFVSMAETLRGGLSLADSGFAYWSHDIGGFEDDGDEALYKRWIAFGMLSSHSRLHGSSSYRVPWNYGDEACDVLRFFTRLKCSLMPYLYRLSIEAAQKGWPLLRPMHLEFPQDRTAEGLDRQFMLGESLLVAPVFRADGVAECYLPEGVWFDFFTGERVQGGRWLKKQYDFFRLPLFVRDGAILPLKHGAVSPDEDYSDGTEFRVYGMPEDAECAVYNHPGEPCATFRAGFFGKTMNYSLQGAKNASVLLIGAPLDVDGCRIIERSEAGQRFLPD